MSMKELQELRSEVDKVNAELLRLLNRRAGLVERIGEVKTALGAPHFDPRRESDQLEELAVNNPGPLRNDVVKRLFKEIFRISLDLMDTQSRKELLVHRKGKEDTVVTVGDVAIGGAHPPVVIAGPCSVESASQLERIAAFLSSHGVRLLRGGVFKPRSSPYAFQGLGLAGLPILQEITRKYNMFSVSEVLDPRHLDAAYDKIDVFQIGARNMHNYELLKLVGELQKPVLLKRGFMSTIEEFLLSAEYIMMGGNSQIILCERGIRTFEHWTRNTLDISAIPIVKNETHLPIIVDISHSTGRKDIAIPVAAAAIAAGGNGIMVEVHDQPEVARSDSGQQLTFDECARLLEKIRSCS